MSLNEMKDGFDHLKEAVLDKIESKERKQEEITKRCKWRREWWEKRSTYICCRWCREKLSRNI